MCLSHSLVCVPARQTSELVKKTDQIAAFIKTLVKRQAKFFCIGLRGVAWGLPASGAIEAWCFGFSAFPNHPESFQ